MIGHRQIQGKRQKQVALPVILPGGFGRNMKNMQNIQNMQNMQDMQNMTRWVWQHSIKDASFTSWAEGAPATGENFKDCALMSIEVVSFMI